MTNAMTAEGLRPQRDPDGTTRLTLASQGKKKPWWERHLWVLGFLIPLLLSSGSLIAAFVQALGLSSPFQPRSQTAAIVLTGIASLPWLYVMFRMFIREEAEVAPR